MKRAAKLLRQWRNSVPRNGVAEEDVVTVLDHVGLTHKRNGQGHILARHENLIGSDSFPFGTFTISCHAHGKQGMAHPLAIRDLLRAVEILDAAREQEENEE